MPNPNITIAVPTVNPFTGKTFADKAEKDAFIAEQAAAREAMAVDRAGKRASREVAVNKVMQVFVNAGVTEEEVREAFGPRVFRNL